MAMTLHALAQTRSPAEIAHLVAQVLAGQLTNKDLTQLLQKPRRSRIAASGRGPKPAPGPGHTPTAPSIMAEPEPPATSVTVPAVGELGRFADLTLGTAAAASPAPARDWSRNLPSGDDDDALIAAGLLTVDGTDLAQVPEDTRAAYLLLQHLDQAHAKAEALRQTADLDRLPSEAQQELASIVDGLLTFLAEIRPEV